MQDFGSSDDGWQAQVIVKDNSEVTLFLADDVVPNCPLLSYHRKNDNTMTVGLL